MIFTERKITVNKGQSTIDRPVILYRGDYEVEIRFTIVDTDFKYINGNNNNATEKASHAQLAILGPDGTNVFSDISVCMGGQVAFVLTKEMIDELREVGLYSFQIRLFDYYRESRVSIPPVEFGIEVREPVASEDHDNEVNNAIVGYSIAKVVDGLNEDVGDTFDDNGNYNKTDWETGDRISQGKLNKIEDALDEINQNEKNDVAALDKRINSNYNVLASQLEEKANLNEVFTKENGININDFDEPTRQTFLEAQGINVNYVLGEGNVKPVNTSFMNRRINLYDNISVNNLGLNDSGTSYPATGKYASGLINLVGSGLYVKMIKRVIFYDSEDGFLGVNRSNNPTTLIKITIPDNATKIRYEVESSCISQAFISNTDEELFVEEYGYKLPLDHISKNEFNNAVVNLSPYFKVSMDNCDFFNAATNLYDNKSVNNLGINNSSTKYPLTGGYVGSNINIGENKYIYYFNIGKILFKDENNKTIKHINCTSGFVKIEIPTDATKFDYSVMPSNILTASIYLTDYELSENPPLPKLKDEYLNMSYIKNSINTKEFNTVISCYGDSLTEGAGSTNAGVYSYPAQLSNIINKNAEYNVSVLNRGIGGNTSLPIAYKSGCYADMVNPFIIPADTTPVTITKTGSLANRVNGTASIRNGVNPVTINGIQGNLSYSDGVYKFTRLEAGNEIEISRPMQILPSASQTDKNSVLIICMGTNDADKSNTDYPPKLIQRIRKMIEYLDCKEFIIVGLTVSEKDYINSELEKEFGANFIDIHEYLINYGLFDNNLTATAEDEEDISNGLIPRQLRSDSIHYNNQGYYSKAMGIYLKGKDLGYWK